MPFQPSKLDNTTHGNARKAKRIIRRLGVIITKTYEQQQKPNESLHRTDIWTELETRQY